LNARVGIVTLVGLALLVAMPVACDENTCMNRGVTHAYSGTASWSSVTGGNGSTETLLRVDDFDPYGQPQGVFVGSACSEHGMGFTLHVGDGDGCTLWAHESGETSTGAGTRYDPRVVVVASADIEAQDPTGTCLLPVEEGNAVVNVTGGRLCIFRGGAAQLTLEGTISSWPGAANPTGPFKWTLAPPE
jgi:hypothetical protein